MKVRIFASELSRCRKVKFLFGLGLSFSIFTIVVIFPLLWVLKAPVPKTDEDFVREYLVQRLTFTPDTVKEAYYNDLQYIFALYDEVVKPEIDFVRKNRVYQYVMINHVQKEPQVFRYVVSGRLLKFSCNNVCEKILDRKVNITVRKIKNKYLLEEIK